MAVRSQWKGTITAGVLNVPVRLYGATEANDVTFNNLHRACGQKISAPRICEPCGNVRLAPDEMVRGYAVGDAFVQIEPEDLEGLPVASLKAIVIDQFAVTTGLDPRRIEASYFLAPEPVGAKAFALLRAGLIQTGRSAVAKIAMRNREHLCIVRPFGEEEVLLLQTMLWDDELRAAAPYTEKLPAVTETETGMAVQLIEAMSGDGDLSGMRDEYAAALRAVVEAKIAGLAPAKPAPQPIKHAVDDLMASLRASIEGAKAKRKEAA